MIFKHRAHDGLFGRSKGETNISFVFPPSIEEETFMTPFSHAFNSKRFLFFNHCFAFSISYIFSPLNWFLIHQASILPKVCTVSNLLCWLVFILSPYFSTVILTFYKQNSAFQNYVSRFSTVYMTFFNSFGKLIYALKKLN